LKVHLRYVLAFNKMKGSKHCYWKIQIIILNDRSLYLCVHYIYIYIYIYIYNTDLQKHNILNIIRASSDTDAEGNIHAGVLRIKRKCYKYLAAPV